LKSHPVAGQPLLPCTIQTLGVNPLSLRKITEILEVPKSTCAHIYKHALKNAAQKRLVVELEREGWDTECDAFLAGIDTQLDSLYAVPEVQTVLGESSANEEYIPLQELISAECLDSDARSGRPQVLSEVEKDHLVATVRHSWGTRHMSLTELQLEAGLGHVSRGTIFNTLHSRGITAYVEECKFILDEENKQRRVVCTWHLKMQ